MKITRPSLVIGRQVCRNRSLRIGGAGDLQAV